MIDYPTLAQCYYCEKDNLVNYFNFLLKPNSISFTCSHFYSIAIKELFQIVRDRMWEEDLMCSLLPSKIEKYKRGLK